jgi:hypothetical protein
VGVAGTLYLNTTTDLEALVIKEEALKSIHPEIHKAAVKAVHSI